MKSHFKKTLLFASLTAMPTAYADPIGINFGSGRANASLLPSDTSGVVAQANWNNADGPSGGPITLNDATGTASAVQLTWATDEQWSFAGPAADANGTLLTGWISANNVTDPPATVTLTGVPFDLYDIYVYFAHDRDTEDVLISEANSIFPAFLAHEDDTDILGTVTFVEQTLTADGDLTQVGNYARFTNLNREDIQLILEPAGAGGTAERGAITGIQIVEVLIGDADGDGLDDNWEAVYGLDPNDNGLNPNNNNEVGNPDNGADGDPDNDGLTNAEEQSLTTFPNNEDTDNDGLLDGVETGDGNYVDATMTGTDPLKKDTDGDTLQDNVENNSGVYVDENMTGTNPNEADTDNDTLLDNWEIATGLSPFDDGTTDPDSGASGDPDLDNSINSEEQTRGTDPQDDDSDDDTLLDGIESGTGIFVGTSDTGTDPLNPDTDGDSLRDDYETNSEIFVSETDTGTNPLSPDSDGDIFSDGWEINNGRNPLNPSDNLAEAGSIGLNFGAGRDNATLLDTDMAGVAPQTNWNNLPSNTGDGVALNDNSGSPNGASVNWALDEEWSIGGPGLDANGTLLNGWISANNGGAANTIDISNIPYGSYDLIFYINHDRGTEDVLISEANSAFPQFLAHENDTDTLAEITFNHQAVTAEGDGTQSGNFLVIPNLTSPNLNLVMGPAGDFGSADRGSINGIQIVNRGGGIGLAITSITVDRDAGSVTLTWNSVNGRNYVIEAGPSPDLQPANEIDDYTATGDVSTYTENGLDFLVNPKRFYRIREVTNN